MGSADLITIDGLSRTKTTLDGTERLIGRDGSGDFKALVSAIKSYIQSVSTKSASYTILDTDLDDIFILSGASAAATFTLPTLADNQARVLEFINADSTYTLVIDGEGAETITGMASFTILPGHTCRIIATASEWKILSSSFEIIPVQGTNYAVYTKTFTGNLDADSSTSIAHGETVSKIIGVQGMAYDDNFSAYVIADAYIGSVTDHAYLLTLSSTDIIFGVGSYFQNNAYKVTITYYVD